MTSALKVTIGNRLFNTITDFSLVNNVESAQRSFSASIPLITANDGLIYDLDAKIDINNERVLTGAVDTVSITTDSTSKTINITGRSRTRDLVDSSIPGLSWTKTKLSRIIRDIGDIFVINIRIDAGYPDPVIDKFQANDGDGAFETLDRLAEMTKFLVTDTPEGEIVFTRAKSISSIDKLEIGVNVLATSITFDSSQRFRRYNVFSENKGSDDKSGKTLFVSGSAEDFGVLSDIRTKTILVDNMSRKEAAERAQWEAQSGAARSIQAAASVVGWTQSDGSLWLPNRLSNYINNDALIKRDMLIKSVTYSRSNSGETTEMDLTIPEAFAFDPAQARALQRPGQQESSILRVP